MSEFEQTSVETFGPHRLQVHAPLAPLTTFKVGGPADWLLETRASDEIVTAIDLARRFDVPVTLLGGGSNVLIGDAGVRGLVVRPRGGAIHAVDERHVRADAAVTINGLVRWTVLRGLAGLEVWAGTPGTVGGAIFGNAHFGGRLIGELVTEVRAGQPRRPGVGRAGVGDGVRIRSEPAAGQRRSAAVSHLRGIAWRA